MGISPLILAALAKDAVPALDFVQVAPLEQRGDGFFDSACLTGADGSHYVIKMARGQQAGLVMDTELMVLRSLNPHRARLPFEITKLLGETRDAKGKRALLFSFIYGGHTDIARVGGDSPLSTSMANALAAIHSLPLGTVEENGLPSYSPADILKRRVSELDRAAQTGKVPAALLSRWEQALEDVNLWRFNPTVVHGHVDGETFLSSDNGISGVLAWQNLHIGDPAEDFSWIVGYGDDDFAYSTLLEYGRLRGNDDNLRARAQLYSEMDIADYLLEAIAKGDEDGIDFAIGSFQTFLADIEAGLLPSVGPKPLAFDVPAPVEASSFETVSGFEPAAFVDAAQAVVADDLLLNPASSFLETEEIDEALPMPVALEDSDPAAVDIESASIFKPVVDSSYNHKNLFDETGPIDISADDATAPISLPPVVSEEAETDEDNPASRTTENGELF